MTQMTYQTVIGVRYSELVTVNPTGCTFGRFVPPDKTYLICIWLGDVIAVKVPVNLTDERSNWYPLCRTSAMTYWLYPTRNSGLAGSRRGTGVHEYFVGSLLAVHAGVSRGPSTYWSFCPGCAKHKSLHWATNRHFWTLGQPATLSNVRV